MKIILHIDMNAFFASVEEVLNPKLVNQPIAVCGKTTRSVVASPNYIARKLGIKAAMPVFQAKKICRKLAIVDSHFDDYKEYSHKFITLLRTKITNKIEQISIDECFVDVTNLCKSTNYAFILAQKIQNLIYKTLKLKTSIGVSYNKFLAKMASDLKKPMGITTIFTKKDIKEKIWPLPVNDMYLIGKSTARILNDNGIFTIGDIAKNKNKRKLKEILDVNWEMQYFHANGYGDDELNYSYNEIKSISCSETFLVDTSNFDEIIAKISELTQQAYKRMKELSLCGKTFSVVVKYPNFVSTIKSITYKYLNDFNDILKIMIDLYVNNFAYKQIRLVGISIHNLKSSKQINSPLFDNYKSNHENIFKKIINDVNKEMSLDIIDLAKNKLD